MMLRVFFDGVRCCVGLVGICGGLAGGLYGQQRQQTRAEEHAELRTTVGQWMEVMRETQEEERRWVREEQVLRDHIAGLEAELESVREDVKAVKGRLAEADESSQADLGQKREYDAGREALRDGLPEVEEAVAGVLPLIPDFYLGESSSLRTAVEQVERFRKLDEEGLEKESLNGRLRALATVLTELERFQQKVWVVGPMEVPGQERLMKVVYLGLGVAFGVDEGGTVAVRGRPGPEGWSFERLEEEGIEERVLGLVGAADKSGESQLVDLPLGD